MSVEIEQVLQSVLSGIHPPTGPLSCRPIGGGSINDTYQVLTKDNKRWFGKFNNAHDFPDLFVKEARGLALLNQQQLFRVPTIAACSQVGDTQVLLLEWIDSGPQSPRFWRDFGQSLALLHQVTSTSFGLPENNYMGALPQDNTPSPTWLELFIHRRLEPQIHIARTHGLLDETAHRHFQRLYQHLPEIFPPEPPSLLHGDLWSGNFLCDTHSKPVLIDPAVYFGHRSVDLAMTTLFGGFAPAFYEAYAHHYPLPPNYREQWEICNLYPLLIHLNLFGKSYLANILNTIQRF
ncbi:MAG: fructosamine kinase family protein [Bacteroidetes bacterium]|nr:fructosamine kinase family protein [Bacteroidota bacterium]